MILEPFSRDESFSVHHLGKSFVAGASHIVRRRQGKDGIMFDEDFE